MAATDERAIHEFPTGTIDDNSLLIMDRPTLTPGEYETEKFAIANLALKILGGIDFPNNLDTDDQDIFGAINEVNAKAMNMADVYDPTTTSANKYEKGDLCIKDNTLYKCTAQNGTYGAWDSTAWTATSIAVEIGRIDTALSELLIHRVLTVTFDTTGRGTYTNPSGYLPICAQLDTNWNIVIHSTGNIVAHGWQDYNAKITNTTVDIGFVFAKL